MSSLLHQFHVAVHVGPYVIAQKPPLKIIILRRYNVYSYQIRPASGPAEPIRVRKTASLSSYRVRHRERHSVCSIKQIKEQCAGKTLYRIDRRVTGLRYGNQGHSDGPGKDLAVDFGEAVGVGGPGEEADAGKAGVAAGVPGVGVRLAIGEKGKRGGGPGWNVADGTIHRRVAANFRSAGMSLASSGTPHAAPPRPEGRSLRLRWVEDQRARR